MAVKMHQPRETAAARHPYAEGDLLRWVERDGDELRECVGPALWVSGSHVGLESPVDGAELALHYTSVTPADSAEEPPGPTVRERLAAAAEGARRRWRRLKAAWRGPAR